MKSASITGLKISFCSAPIAGADYGETTPVDPTPAPHVDGWMRKLLLLALLSLPAFAQYNFSAGQSAPTTAVEKVTRDKDGREKKETVYVPVAKDTYGNAGGSQYDL